MPPVPDYSCSHRPRPGVMLAKPCFMHALWYPPLLVCPREWDHPSSSFSVVSIPLVLHPTLMPDWAPALAEEPGEGKYVPHVHTHIPVKYCPYTLELCNPKSLGAQHCRGQCQEVLVWVMPCCQSGQQDPESWRWDLSAGPGCRTSWGPSLPGMGCTDSLPALQESLYHRRR